MKKHLEMNKSLVTNVLAVLLLLSGLWLGNSHLLFVGSYAFSGAITNWIAVYMLFEKIPFLYGSGVIPSRFEDFKRGIKNLIMLQFFTAENIERFFKENE